MVATETAGPQQRGTAGARSRRGWPPRWWARFWVAVRADAPAYLCYLGVAGWTTVHLWRHLGQVALVVNSGDETFFTWLFAYGAQLVSHPHNPFFTTAMNAPVGVNLMANTALFGLTIPLAPVTLAFGPDASFVLADTLALGGTAAAWYAVFARHLVRSRFAAFVGGLVCGFAPGLVAHASGQPDLAAQFLVPFIVLAVLRLAERPVRRGVLLGLLIAYQAFIDEEILYLTGFALAVFIPAYVAFAGNPARRSARRFLAGLGVAVAVAGILLAYPLWVQFRGPQSYHGLPFNPQGYQTDLYGYLSYARQSIAGSAGLASRISISANEDNAGFGAPLAILGTALAWWLWRLGPLVRATVVTGIAAVVMSLGPTVRWYGRSTGIPGPYTILRRVPLLDMAVPGRFSLVLMPVLAVLLALGIQAVGERAAALRSVGFPVRLLGGAALAAVLVPMLPLPLPVTSRAPVPDFVTSGRWRAYVSPGQTIVSVPLPAYRAPAGLYWQARAGLAYPVPRGYFLGPSAGNGSRALFGAPPRPTATSLYAVAVAPLVPRPYVGGDTPLGRLVAGDGLDPAAIIGPADRAAARADLTYWHAAIVIMAPQRNEEPLWRTVSDLLGAQPAWVDGVWLWDVHRLTAQGGAAAPVGPLIGDG